MYRTRWFFHPIAVFVFSIVALGLSLALYIYWYMEVSSGLDALVRRFNIDPQQVLESQTWVVILVLSLLVGIILMGIFTIFVYNQKAVQLYRLQNNFINNFTHELKTPVTSLKLYLETFAMHQIDRNDQLKYIGYMIRDVERLSDNINRILDLARIESKSYRGDFATSDLAALVEKLRGTIDHLFPNCEIIVCPADELFEYPINESLFEMLLINLVTNAIKYNESEKPRIEISFNRRKRFIQIMFRDNGIGLEKSEIKKVFKRFYQAGHSDNMSAKGSGIGLYLVQNIAKLHQGKVIAESEGPGRGSTFTLMLPIKKTGDK